MLNVPDVEWHERWTEIAIRLLYVTRTRDLWINVSLVRVGDIEMVRARCFLFQRSCSLRLEGATSQTLSPAVIVETQIWHEWDNMHDPRMAFPANIDVRSEFS